MTIARPDVELLKNILENIHNPEQLNCHPWTSCLFVRETVEKNPHLRQESPGWQLLVALSDLFSKMMPSAPPRRGKRLDNHWGEFGILAARYFVPLQFGTAIPSSLREAWGRIDAAIFYCVYRKPVESLTEEQIRIYQLVGTDLEYACVSTLSDWHRKGLQRFTEFVFNHEHFLSKSRIPNSQRAEKAKASRGKTHWLELTAILLLVLAIGLGSLKISRIYKKSMQVYQDVGQLQDVMTAPMEIQNFKLALPALRRLQADLISLKEESRFLLWLAPKLDWLPVYGKDLFIAPQMFELSEHLLAAAIYSCQAAQPVLNDLGAQDISLDPARLTDLLVRAQPTLGEARSELDQALNIRKNINAENLSPAVRGLIVDKLDPMIKQADEDLSFGMVLPGIIGASNKGPQTYLLLVENEDELRPTGGFITSVGNLVVYKGQIISLDFEAVDEQEDWSRPYPAAPWQLQEYMNNPILTLRDANWFTNFPTTVLWAESLYANTHSHSVDGVIAFDQHFLVMLLGQIGPLEVEGAPYPITSENVMEYMRQSKKPPAGGIIPANWTRKDFIGKIAASVLKELYNEKQNWRAIAGVLSDALVQRHLLLQFDDPIASSLLAKRGWDNAVRAGTGDFLMVTDTNIGFNKTNAAVDVSLNYDIDFSDLNSPVGTLTLIHKNSAKQNVPCIQWDSGLITGEEWYPIDRCYWSYVRVYRQEGVQLLSATPHAIPGDWMVLGEDVPARVDALEEEIPGVMGFGTLLVVPGGGTVSTAFQFKLSQAVLSFQQATNDFTYHLKVQKQPGTLEHPLTIRVHFPKRAELKFAPPGAVIQNNSLLLATNLRTDVGLNVVFTIP